MKLHRFFISDTPLEIKEGEEVNIEEKEILHQWKSVLRLEVGEKVTLLDNSGKEYDGEILLLDKKQAKVKILRIQNAKKPKIKVTLCFALIKKIPLEWMLEKATEIGVSHFQPIISERTEVKEINLDRANKILKEASEQSGRNILPAISEPMKLKEFVSNISPDSNSIAFDSSGSSFSSGHLPKVKCHMLFIGPEGGWSEGDLSVFKEKNIPVFSLGDQTLRAETATLATLSLLLLGN